MARGQKTASMNEMAARYRAHNNELAARLGVRKGKDVFGTALAEAREHLSRSQRSPSATLRVAAMQDAIESLVGALEAAARGTEAARGAS